MLSKNEKAADTCQNCPLGLLRMHGSTSLEMGRWLTKRCACSIAARSAGYSASTRKTMWNETFSSVCRDATEKLHGSCVRLMP